MSAEWSRYWARETSGACLPGAPPAVQDALIGTWKRFFGARFAAFGSQSAGLRVLDVASGGGSVLKILLESGKDRVGIGIDAADVGPAAAALGVRGGIDAHALPFAEASFDIVTSQFGLEYCRRAAWAAAARVLVPGGHMLLICHHRESAAVLHNGRRLAAMQALADAGLFALAEGLAAGRGEDPALMARVVATRQAHASQSVVDELPAALGQWARAGRRDAVAAIQVEAEAEMTRLAAMQAAALDGEAVAERVSWLGMPARCEVLAGPDGPIAWVMAGSKV
jgi:SAM-dependent methyltransferase